MQKVYLPFIIILLFISLKSHSQTRIGTEIKINLTELNQSLVTANSVIESNLPMIDLPLPDGTIISYRIKESAIASKQPTDIKTYSGQTIDNAAKIRFSITPTGGFNAIIHHKNEYYIIEPIDKDAGTYQVYNMNDTQKGNCNNNGAQAFGRKSLKNGRILSISPFPVGAQLRTYRMAAAATGQMVITYGGQSQAKDKIVSIMNAINLIYELEASIRFSLISQSTSSPYLLMFTTPSTDPFTVDPDFASAYNSQDGYDILNTNVSPNPILLYSQYDVAHTFNSYISSNSTTWGEAGASLPTYYVRGQAGGQPCDDFTKAAGWTEFVNSASLGSIVNIAAHEIAHQFAVGHTYNAIGGSAPPNNTSFCTDGWNDQSAVEPGSGSTLMGYNSNCYYPNNYVLSTPNFEGYFHTKSLEEMYVTVNTVSTCFTSSATNNAIPTANAGSNYTIPKGTPFALTGSATDASSPADALSYAWDQFDVATANDKGAFGSDVSGAGGYTAVNSPASAPLFRSKILSVPTRTFPSLSYILNNANDPVDSRGEDLPQVARTMKFRFTVRDNHAGGGGVDSDDANITVDSKGPFLISSQNTATTWYANGTNTATVVWSVNGTHLSPILCTNVKISLSTDGGTTFPIVLAASTPNDGSEVITIPNNTTTTGRIKVEAIGNIFFDINNASITIVNTCSTTASTLSPTTSVTATAGSTALKLILTPSPSATYKYVIVNTTTNNIVAIQDSSTLRNSAIFVPASYKVYGFSTSVVNFSAYLGTSFTTFQGLLPATVCGQLSSNSVSVTIQSCANAAPTLSAPASVCMGDSTLLTATGCAGTVIWTASPSWSALPTGASSKVAPTETTTFYATCFNSGCAGPASSVLVTVNPVPTPPTSTTGATIARNATASLTATGCSGTINWFSTATSTTVVGTGSPFVTPALTNSATYYAACFNGTCNSARLPATATVTNPCLAPNSIILPSAALTAAAGNSALNLGLVGLGNTITSFSGNIASTDPTSNLSFKSYAGTCGGPSYSNRYDKYSFMVNTTGSYTFNISGTFGILINLYAGTYSTSGVCTNWLTSSALETSAGGGPSTLINSVIVTLTANTLYTLVVSSFSSSFPTFPASYTISFTPPSGATVNETLPSPGSAYSYTYVVTENTSGAIVGFSATSNLTSATTYGAGLYTVRGLSYETSSVTNLSSYINTPFTTFQTLFPLPNCGAISSNSKPVTITGCPSPPIVLPVTINSGSTATLTAYNCAGTVNWYDASTGGTLMGTGSPFTTAALNTNTNYYASCTVGGCSVTSRTNVLVTVNPCPAISTLSGTGLNGVTYKASNGIESTQIIDVNTTVTYQTGNYTLLTPGFEAKAGSVFKTQYGGCQ